KIDLLKGVDVIHEIKLQTRVMSQSLLRDNWLIERRVAELLKHERYTPQQLDAWRREMLAKTLRVAAGFPAYAQLAGRPISADNAEDLLKTVPLITKSDLVTRRAEFYPVKRPWHALGRTGGTTGTPLSVIRSMGSVLSESAFVKRHWAWSGFQRGMPSAVLRGELVVPLEQTDPPFWTVNRLSNQMMVSSRHLKSQFARPILDAFEQFAPKLMQAYPAAAYTLAQLAEQEGRELKIPYIYTSSEIVLPHQLEKIESVLGARVMDLYGMAERVVLATGCEHGHLHVNTDYSWAEIVDENGQPTDGIGSLVGTTFHNHAMPLLRYQLGDLSRWLPGECPCGRPFPRIEPVSGRTQDQVFDRHGNPLSPALLTFVVKTAEHIREAQIAQVALDRWQVRVVRYPQYDQGVEDAIRGNFLKHIDDSAKVDFVYVDEIPRTAAGKFRWLVNEVQR
ncbi:MAG TPA: hypothetical protein VLC08_09475, partial [Chitinolyticbacter sp.]|nr:hypothetical protein [Chitinolyticbacter sp.]